LLKPVLITGSLKKFLRSKGDIATGFYQTNAEKEEAWWVIVPADDEKVYIVSVKD